MRVCVRRGWELPAPRGVSVHARGAGHRPGAEEGSPRGSEGDRHGELQGSFPDRAAPVAGVHPDRPALHHHGEDPARTLASTQTQGLLQTGAVSLMFMLSL